MNDGPPGWMDEAPPTDPGAYGQPAPAGGGHGGKAPYKSNKPPAMTQEQLADASADFYEWLTTPATLAQLKIMLPEHVDAEVFIATAKTAVLTKPDLLREDLRQSLLTSIMKAAGQGLLPDGKQGALIARYDTEARKYQVAWQPMVQGIMKLGRETGAIRNIRAVIVFFGEPFRIIQGDEDRIEHEVEIDIVEEAYAALNNGKDDKGNPRARPAEFMGRVRAAYCVITGSDGTVTKRWMTKQRLVSLWESSRAANGPWNSRWIDEMILKGVILFTAKWINLDSESVQAKRFQSALMTDMEVDFNHHGHLGAPANQDRPQQAALPPPADKLGSLEDVIMGGGKVREKVPVDPGRETSSPSQSTVSGATGGGGSRPSSPGPSKQQAEPQTAGRAENSKPPTEQHAQQPAGETPWIDRTTAVLTAEANPSRWLSLLTAAMGECPTMDDLAAMKRVPSVVLAEKGAPPHIRSQIANGFVDAGKRMAEAAIPDEEPAAGDDGDDWPGPKSGEAA